MMIVLLIFAIVIIFLTKMGIMSDGVFAVLLIGDALAMGLWWTIAEDKLDRQLKESKEQKTKTTNTPKSSPGNVSKTVKSNTAKASTKGTLTFLPGVLSEHDSEFSKATYSNGVVYGVFSRVGERPVGYYKRVTGDSVAEYKVYREKDYTWETGFVGHGNIWLSRKGGYDDLARFYEKYNAAEQKESGYVQILRYPHPMSDIFAVIDGNYIEDLKTGKRIATFTGDPFGAAAAFVAMSFEVHEDSKYSRFTNQTTWRQVDVVKRQ